MKYKKIILACLISLALSLTACGQKIESNQPVVGISEEDIVEVTTVESTTAEPTTEEPSLDIIPEEYAYALTITINPEVCLYLDKNNEIVGIAYKNQDAEDAYSELNLVGATYDDGLSMIVNAAIEKEYLKEEGNIEVELSDVKDTTITDNTPLMNAKEAIRECLENEDNASINATIDIKVADAVTKETGIEPVVMCPDCNGTGNDCKECNGTSIVNCKRCVGGVETCGICNGTGGEHCHGCNGTGIEPTDGTTCGYCGGAGHFSCSGCGGTGSFLCSWCKGELRHICPECWGEGVCSTCNGTGLK